METSIKELFYMFGCYMVVADKEINALELNVLDEFLLEDDDSSLSLQRGHIFSDSPEKEPLEKLFNKLEYTHLSYAEKQQLIRFLAQIAYSDGYMTGEEEKLLRRVSECVKHDPSKIIYEEKHAVTDNIEKARLGRFKRLWGNTQNYFYDRFANKENVERLDKLFESTGFDTTLENLTDDAIIDLKRVAKILNEADKELGNTQVLLSSTTEKRKDWRKDFQPMIDTIKNMSAHFADKITHSVEENKTLLDKKERNIRYFTIAFMGRTKAGKSTLHQVITQQKISDIGIGKLRTTRYNRSWYWDKLRIVDTPGIGAPGGETDANIAKSIIDESDVVCYVVTSDSIQETEFDFLEVVKEHNKPLYIILNFKSNLSENIRRRRFLEKPNDWRTNTGPTSIQGHIDRINERLSGKYNTKLIHIIPIHLLAAQLSFDSSLPEEERDKLLKGSNILEFTRSIKKEIHQSGSLQKGMSVIDGTAYNLSKISRILSEDNQLLKSDVNTLTIQRDKLESYIQSEDKKLQESINKLFDGLRHELYNRAQSFAQSNYDNKDAGSLWNNDARVKNILKNFNQVIQSRISDFQEKLKSRCEETISDIDLKFDMKGLNELQGDSIHNTQLWFGITSTLAGIGLLFIPVAGWIVGTITFAYSIAILVIKNLFDSKTEKIKKATDKMYSQLKEGIDKSIDKVYVDFFTNYNKSIKETKNYLKQMFNTYIQGASDITSKTDVLLEELFADEATMNSLIGLRILEYVGKKQAREKKINKMPNDMLRNEYPVIRDREEQSITFAYDVRLTPLDIQKAENATQMIIKQQKP